MSHTIGQIKQDNQQPNNSSQVDRDFLKPEEKGVSPMSTLSDADYEFLFNQLLEGIAHGWHDRRIVKFFVRLGDRAEQEDWVAWLERLKNKVSVLPLQSKRQLGTMMIRLGELTRSTAEADQIGTVSRRIGRELLFGNIESVWEYAGPDLPSQRKAESELFDRLPDDFGGVSSHRVVEETAEEFSKSTTESAATESKLNSVKGKYLQESAMLWEYVGPDLPSQRKAESELFDRLPDDFGAVSSHRVVEETAEESSKLITESAETESKLDSNQEKSSQQLELSTPRSAITDEIAADLVDFPQSVSQTKQTTANKIFSSEPESDLFSSKQGEELFEDTETSSSNSNSITEAELDSDRLQEIAETTPTKPKPEAFDISQVMNLIQEDEELARQISQKLNLAIAKPQSTGSQLDDSSLELIESWFNLGLKQVSLGELTKAIASWERALSINPDLSEAWHNRGSALGRLGNYQAAIKSFQNALAIDPDNYQAWNDRAHALYQLQNWAEAAESWSNAIKIMPGNHLFWYNRGCALEQLERWDEAIASHEKALLIVPNFQPGRSRYINLVADSSRSN